MHGKQTLAFLAWVLGGVFSLWMKVWASSKLRKTSYMVLKGRYDVVKILIFVTQTSGCSSNLDTFIVELENAENCFPISISFRLNWIGARPKMILWCLSANFPCGCSPNTASGIVHWKEAMKEDFAETKSATQKCPNEPQSATNQGFQIEEK